MHLLDLLSILQSGGGNIPVTLCYKNVFVLFLSGVAGCSEAFLLDAFSFFKNSNGQFSIITYLSNYNL